jgi:hypothetical protein
MTPRRVTAVLLAVFLNLALVPCTMALEVVEEGHDCCPPELRLDPSECCQIDVGTSDARSGVIKADLDGGESFAAPAYADLDELSAPRSHALADPPDPPHPQRDLNALFCVYLK